jgi:uncharacterized protein (DUF2141 family)
MRKKNYSCVLFLLVIISPLFPQPNNTGNLTIKFSGLRNDMGFIAIGINRSDKGWPRKPDMEFNWEKQRIEGGVFIAVIEELPFGTYAISVLDDENSNLEMDMILGIPKEGYGFSNNPDTKLKAPSFESCSFRLNSSHKEIIIKLKYIGKG